LNKLNDKLVDGLEHLENKLIEKKENNKGSMFSEQLESIIQRKKKNIEYIKQLRSEFIKIV
jgi:hypothetical protein